MNNTITLAMVRETAKSIVAKVGDDYRYTTKNGCCKYVYLEQPDCIVGMILYNLGVSISILKKLDKSSYTGGSSMIASPQASTELRNAKIGIDTKARKYLNIIQRSQDGGKTWGDALRDGEYAYAENFL